MIHKRKHFVRRHIIVISVVIFLSAFVSVFLYMYNNQQESLIKDTIASSESSSKDIQAKIDQVLAEKAAIAAAELKAHQEQDAKIAAEQAKTATAATAVNIDSLACNTSLTHTDPSKIDVLVNKKHCVQPVTYVPSDLVNIDGATLSAKASTSFDAMYNAAVAAGYAISVTSSYRSYSTQVATYNYWVSVSGKNGADTYSARPGYSEHQTGLAIDLASGGCALSCFSTTALYGWLQENASKYGFIQRYYKGDESVTGYSAEEWHYRYVGVDVATDMKSKSIKTLEEYWGLTGGDY